MIIKNLIDFIACNLDKKLSQIEHMVEKNNKNFKKAQINYDKIEKKVLLYKVAQKGGAIQDQIKGYFEMIKKTGVSLENSNLEKATQEFQEVNFIEEDLAGLGSIDTDKTYSDIQFMDFNNGSSKTIYNFRHSSSKVYEQGINQDRLQATAGTPQTYTDNTFGDRTFNTYNMEPNISKDFSYSKIEKITSEIGNSTISNMYNLANLELNYIDDKENQFRQN
jgi:hypothetical protein